MTSNEEICRAVEGQTIATKFRDTVRQRPDAVALRWKEGDALTGAWTWAEYAERATRVAAGLRALGVEHGERIVLLLRNRPEFYALDTGAVLAGAASFSIYNSSAPEQVSYQAGHSESVVGVANDIGMLERFLKVRSELPNLRHLVVVDDPDRLAPPDVIHLDDLLDHTPDDLDEAAGRAQPGELATLIYTSGTTGPPKGVMISHANVCWVLESCHRAIGFDIAGWQQIAYLPMAHIAERMLSHYMNLGYATVATSCPDPAEVGAYLREIRPEFFFGVPRVWEKIGAGLQAVLAADPSQEPQLLSMVGLENCRLAFCGAAPLPVGVLKFFVGLGLPMSEIYGMSEAAGPATWSPRSPKVGSVGAAIPGQELRIIEDGEIHYRGGNIFMGYLKDPEKTAEALDEDGWLHSGDIAKMDDDGHVYIVDRKKELIITAGGKNISPANLESALKSFPLIGQACAVGDGRPYMVALVVLDPDGAAAWAKSQGIGAVDLESLSVHPDVIAEVDRCVAEANTRFNRVEQIKKVAILPAEWPPDSEELTPTMKLKRRGILSKYADEIESLYQP